MLHCPTLTFTQMFSQRILVWNWILWSKEEIRGLIGIWNWVVLPIFAELWLLSKEMEANYKGSPSYYSVLGVSSDSSDEEIRRAYRKLAMVIKNVFYRCFCYFLSFLGAEWKWELRIYDLFGCSGTAMASRQVDKIPFCSG